MHSAGPGPDALSHPSRRTLARRTPALRTPARRPPPRKTSARRTPPRKPRARRTPARSRSTWSSSLATAIPAVTRDCTSSRLPTWRSRRNCQSRERAATPRRPAGSRSTASALGWRSTTTRSLATDSSAPGPSWSTRRLRPRSARPSSPSAGSPGLRDRLGHDHRSAQLPSQGHRHRRVPGGHRQLDVGRTWPSGSALPARRRDSAVPADAAHVRQRGICRQLGTPRSRAKPGGISTSSGVSSCTEDLPSPSSVESTPFRKISRTFSTPA